MADSLKRNRDGYIDPTAYAALKTIMNDGKAEKKAAYLISVLKFIIPFENLVLSWKTALF